MWADTHVQQEPEGEDGTCGEPAEQRADQEHVKEEPEFRVEESCVKPELLGELYADHEVKDELVLGPERPHRPDGGLVVREQLYFLSLERSTTTHSESASASANAEQTDPPRTTNTLQVTAYTNIYLCDMCGSLFKRKQKLIHHIKEHMQLNKVTKLNEPKSYNREKGKNKFTHSTSLKTHRHTEEPYFCQICEKKFTRADYLAMHQRIHTGDKPYSCEVCEKKFTQMSNLKTHILTHTKETPYICEVCKKNFTTPSGLKIHKRIHTDDKPYSCKICKKKFRQLGNLKTHIRTHTREKPYICEVCKKKFTQAAGLIIHKRIHTGDKPYCCKICQKKCRQAVDLQRHILTHTGEKPFSCEKCKKKFTRSNNLKIHMRVHTRE
ncbi:zinc finger protein 239-like [Cydia pomonella]|uniref:zinc finger protein 239-like n=1 Tax=Cydia pomonella TaxID=82600 RepID=UPI002ADDC60E|nr:zinc finger protein 239-like [Cydia pomonella]